MRIAFVTETWLPSTDGIVTRLTATVRELRALGHEVMIVAPRQAGMQLDGVRVRGVPTVGWKFIYDGKRWALPLPRVARYIREFRPDIVHAVNPALVGIAAVLAARRQNIPLTASYHTDIARYAAFYRLGLLRPLIWWVLRTLHRRAQLNLATSQATCTELRERGIPRVRLWPRGVDTELFHPRERASTSTPPRALYVGRLGAEKNIAQLAQLLDRGSYRLTLVGDGPERGRLERTLPADSVTFTGTLDGAELAKAYRQADVFVFPSTTETLGLVLLEALASGVPVVAALSPVSEELLGGCKATALYDSAAPRQLSAVANRLLCSAPREILADAARNHVLAWTWANSTETLLSYYRELTSGVSPPRRAGLRTRRVIQKSVPRRQP